MGMLGNAKFAYSFLPKEERLAGSIPLIACATSVGQGEGGGGEGEDSVSPAICLRACYAVPDTEKGHGAPRAEKKGVVLRGAAPVAVPSSHVQCPMLTCAYRPTPCPTGTRITCPMPCPVLTYHMTHLPTHPSCPVLAWVMSHPSSFAMCSTDPPPSQVQY
eukprot:3467000-Rhodomonas_salina.5